MFVSLHKTGLHIEMYLHLVALLPLAVNDCISVLADFHLKGLAVDRNIP